MTLVAHPQTLVEWTYVVRTTCQTFGNRIFQADRYEVEDALDWLRFSLPVADTPQKTAVLRDLLQIGTYHAGAGLHLYYHRRISPRYCGSFPVETAMLVWSQRPDDPSLQLARWTQDFLFAFDARHPWPAAGRAAAILRKRFRNPPNLDELASQANASSRALTRGFLRQYGMSTREYLTRVRLRWAIAELRRPGSCAGRVAEEAGYSSRHSLYDALRQRTGLTPGAIRRVSDAHARAVVDSTLAITPIV
jgi:AraC-like DNA-binding protein